MLVKGLSCLFAEVPAEGFLGGADPVRPQPRNTLPEELRSQGKGSAAFPTPLPTRRNEKMVGHLLALLPQYC